MASPHRAPHSSRAGIAARTLVRRRRPDIGPLRRAAAFADADPRALAALAPRADVLRLPRGRPLAEAGATARELVVVLAGEAVAIAPDGTRVTLGAGTEVGGREVLAGGRHAVTVMAATAVEVLVVDGPALRWAVAEGAVRLAQPATPAPPAIPAASSASTLITGATRRRGELVGQRHS